MEHLLDNIFWHVLSGDQARFSVGDGRARRYAAGFSPIVAFPDPHSPDFAALAPFCARDERFYCDAWSGPAPEGWRIEADATMLKMIWAGGDPPDAPVPEAVPLGPAHVAQAMALAQLTRPGPFGPRTIELGDYFGVFDGARLVAMAGERGQAGRLREISGVCTHPDFQGRGHAGRLTRLLVSRMRGRGETPYLHVMTANAGARALYERLGFRVHKESPVRVVALA